ncbi:unnamed protein product [Blepharisma stoltei]|uniref:Guanylate cyclase domain-containing protein n=1 Tax=Blepharisma stoltei TaxID=1481888 RepID=A0AAU9ITS6_9CILI|nr:unnamed protein product [Blepharisma stoltei]
MASYAETNWREFKVDGNAKVENSIFPNNCAKSTRYTLLTIIPLNLFEQFQRSSNIWFLLVSVFQLIPINLNPTDSWSTIAPLAILLFFTLIKDAYNDLYRWKDDKKINTILYSRWNGENFVKVQSKDMLVGNIVLLNDGDIVPADMILLASEKEKEQVYLDTTGIIGNAIFKEIKKISEIQRFLNSVEDDSILKKFQAKVRMGEPNSDFSKFRGKIKLNGFPKAFDIHAEQALFRGAKLNGTSWAIGLIVYTGHDTKTLLNTRKPIKKTSSLERRINRWVGIILLILFGLVVFSICAYYYISESSDRYSYSTYSLPEMFVTFTLLFNNIIPISLFVTMDIIRILQVIYIQINSRQRINFKTGDINEDLGQVEYVLLNKSGALTECEFTVQLCMIDSEIYRRVENNEQNLISDEEKTLFLKPAAFNINYTERFSSEGPKDEAKSFEKLSEELRDKSSEQKTEFLKCLAVSNSAFPNKISSLSPDDKALSAFSLDLGIKILSNSTNSCEIEINDHKYSYTILGSKPSNSNSKKARVIVRAGEKEPAIMYIKGSYEAIIPLLKNDDIRLNLLFDAKKIINEGTKPVFLARKVLSNEELKDFLQKIEIARCSPLNINYKYENIYSEFEKNADFLGIVGIKDTILPETIECVEALQKAGIKLWLASGDSEDNTIQSAYGAKLLNSHTSLVHIKGATSVYGITKMLQRVIATHIYHEIARSKLPTFAAPQQLARFNSAPKEKALNDNEDNPETDSIVSEYLEEASIILEEISTAGNATLAYQSLLKIGSTLVADDYLSKHFFPETVNFSVSLDRKSFEIALSDQDSRKLMACVLLAAKCVCFHDLLPKDKDNLVKLLKENLSFKPVVLAIGAGNSNISMIQGADIGVGIQGKTHSHASNFCEVSVEHFSVLKDLLLLYGHRNYTRMSRIILLFFYKNFILTAVTFGYIFMSDYSGATIYNSGLLVGYNLLYTTFPLFMLGVFDLDIERAKIFEHPQIYVQGIVNKLFSWKKLVYYSTLSIVQAAIILLLVSEVFDKAINNDGFSEDQNLFGTTMFISTVFVALYQIWIDTFSYNILYCISHILSLALLVGYICISNEYKFPNWEQLGIGTEISKFPISLISFLITPLLAIVPGYFYKAYIILFKPSMRELIMVAPEKAEEIEFSRLANYSGGLLNAYRDSSIWKSNNEKNKFDMNWMLKFISPYIENLYRDHYIHDHILMYRLICGLIWIILLFWTIYEVVVQSPSLSYTVIRIVMVLAFSAVLLLVMLDYFKRHYVFYTLAIIFLFIIAMAISDANYEKTGLLSTSMVPAISYILFDVDYLSITLLNIINIGLFLMALLIYYIGNSSYGNTEAILLIIKSMILIVAISVTSAFIGYFLDKSKREEHKLMNITENAVEKIQTILSYLLPSFVRNRVKKGARYIAEDQGTVTVLFCDIYDFDRICKEYNPNELTTFLDQIFQKFDQMCDTIGVTKIETVGKTYMACAGLKDSELEMSKHLKEVTHARRCIEMSLAIIREIQSIKLKYGSTLQVKIGINSGPVTSGVVGYHKPQFSLVGDTVNTASRMCSTLEQTNAIQISKDTYKLLENHNGLKFEPKEVEAKGKGLMKTFIVTESIEGSVEDIILPMNTMMNNPPIAQNFDPQFDDEDDDTYNISRSLTHFDISDKKSAFKKNDPGIIKPVKICDFSIRETENQKKFRLEQTLRNYVTVLLGLSTAVIAYGMLLAVSILEAWLLSGYSDANISIMRIVIVGALIGLIVIHRLMNKMRFYPLFTIPVLLLMLITVLYSIFDDKKFSDDLIALEIMYIIIILNHASDMPLSAIILVSIGIFTPWVIAAALNGSDLANILLVFGFAIINTSAVYSREQRVRINFNLQHLAEREIQETDKLLVQMMPPHVLENMKQDKSITDKLQDVTLLFADIVGFTAWSSNKRPKQIVKMLSELFTQFDKKCVELSVYKVHTIGDCYVVMGYNGSANRDIGKECLNMLKMAQNMIEIINAVNLLHGSELNMRIGLHTGTVIAGIIGTNIVRYDIYGPDVLIANKMESNGKPGEINVSDKTKELLEKNYNGEFEYTFNKEVPAKAIDRVHQSYFIKPAN